MILLYAAKLLNHFLVDEDGQVKSLLMECLQPKVGSGNDLKATPKHLPDIDNFPVKNIICGPLEVIPKEQDSETFIVSTYEELKEHIAIVKIIDVDAIIANNLN